MSTNIPPGGPAGPEYLEQGGGEPIPGQPSSGRSGRNPAVLAAAAVAGLALVGGGVWAAVAFFSTGPQPAEALPASTIGYASIDLDPSGGQKIEAVKMLRQFPAIKDEIDLDTDDDLREVLFDELGLVEVCEGLDYADDIEPWLGDRAGVAAIDLGEEQPTIAAVLQVRDAATAEEGLAKLQACGSGGGWAVEGEWAVLAETGSIAEEIVAETAKGSLADDADYQKWTDEVGDPGIVNLYAAPEAGQYLADSLGGLLGFGFPGAPMSTGYATSCVIEPGTTEEVCEEVPMATDETMPGDMMSDDEVPEEFTQALEDFEGMAVALRFDDGGLELEFAGDAGIAEAGLPDTDRGDDVLTTLPEDTAVAFGIGFADGWFDDLLATMASYSGAMSVEELVAEAEEETGLDLPEDAETLAGESVAFALGSDFDPETFVNSSNGSDVPVGIKIQGDAEAIEAVLDKVRAQVPAEQVEIVSESDGDMVAVGPDADYVATLLEDGGLGDLDAFESVVDEAGDASVVLFVNFDAGDWLTAVADGDPAAEENLAPLEAFGISSWRDGDVAHAVVRLTTN